MNSIRGLIISAKSDEKGLKGLEIRYNMKTYLEVEEYYGG